MRPCNPNSRITLNHFSVALTFVFAMLVIAALQLNSQQLQKGVSVDLAPTANAKPAPEADQSNAWIVSITADGRLWFGPTPVSAESLAEKMVQAPRDREQNLYIKADGRALYSDLIKVLKASQVAEFDSPILLTGQRTSPQPNGLTPPMGLQVWIESGALTGPKPIDVKIAANRGSPAVSVNNQEVPWSNLQSAIRQLTHNQTECVVRLSAEGDVPFAQVVRAVDAARSAGAKVVLMMPKI